MTQVHTVTDNAIQFSALSPSILEREDRLRVARQILAVLQDHLAGQGLTGRRLLDIGCSSGVITAFLAGHCGPTLGVDVDVSAITLANEAPKPSNLRFALMSGAKLDVPSASQDIVICNQVYYWLEDPSVLMAEILRVLAPGGCCYFSTVNKYKLWEAQYRLPLLSVLPRPVADAYVRATGKGDRFGCRYLSFWELSRLCSAFAIHHYTARILKDPDKYQFTKLSGLKRLTMRLPERWCEHLEPLSPNLIWILEKAR